ncbi:MAG: AcrR family transcriptional regulator [Cognaticolwellia sp.]
MARVSERDWVRAALRSLSEGGAKAIRVEALARDLGVTKGSFYHHFKNRDAVLYAAFDAWRELATLAIIEAVNAGSEEPALRLEALCQAAFFSTLGEERVEAAIRDWAAQDPEIASQLAEVDQRRLDYVQGLLQAHGLSPQSAMERSQILYRCLIGNSVWRRQSGPALTESALRELLALLLSRPPKSA